MFQTVLRSFGVTALTLALLGGTGVAGDSPLGTWIDQTGEGAIRISDCGGKLCGRVIWLKSARNGSGCNLDVIGNVAAQGDGTWGGGWIFDPETRKKFSVEIEPLGEQKLRVLGYAGIKTFGRTMTWTKAPDTLTPCDRYAPAIVTAQAPPTAPPRHDAAAPKQADPGGDPAAAATSPPVSASERAETKVVAEALNHPHSANATPRKPHHEASNSRRRGREKEIEVSDLRFDDVKFRRSRGGCSLTVGDLGRLAFPC